MADDAVLDQTDEVEETDEDPEESEEQLQSGDDLAAEALSEAGGAPSMSAPAKALDPSKLGETLQALQNVIERNADELDRIKA